MPRRGGSKQRKRATRGRVSWAAPGKRVRSLGVHQLDAATRCPGKRARSKGAFFPNRRPGRPTCGRLDTMASLPRIRPALVALLVLMAGAGPARAAPAETARPDHLIVVVA